MLLLKVLSLLGLDRWTDAVLSQVHEAVSEGAGAIEARSRLVRQEWLEEKARMQQLLIYALLCFCLLIGVLILLSLAVIVTFWETDSRLLVCWAVVLFWVVCLLVCVLRIVLIVRQGKSAFKYTKQELKEDWKVIKERL